ncbi:hypothetical protein ROZALSC1DRAFT_16840, partial [Rozella allomycis CSF55]
PMFLDLGKSALLIGNKNIPTIFVAEFQKASGVYGAMPSRSSQDVAKSVLILVVSVLKIRQRTNIDYNRVQVEGMADGRLRGGFNWRRIFKRKTVVETIGMREMVEIDDGEYAKVIEILQSDSLKMNYYVDQAGKYIINEIKGIHPSSGQDEELPPQWGLDLTFHNSVIKYGPWADRQRDLFMKYFYPFHFHDMKADDQFIIGQMRKYTKFKVFVQFTGKTNWRIPHREASKDYRFNNENAMKRAYGWVDVESHGVIINVNVPMVYSETGTRTEYEITFKEAVIKTSVNYSQFLNAEHLRFHILTVYPLKWRDQAKWEITISGHKASVFLLKEHVFQFNDISNDFSQKPKIRLNEFVPFVYFINVNLTESNVVFHCNELNIIQQPCDKNENSKFISVLIKL